MAVVVDIGRLAVVGAVSRISDVVEFRSNGIEGGLREQHRWWGTLEVESIDRENSATAHRSDDRLRRDVVVAEIVRRAIGNLDVDNVANIRRRRGNDLGAAPDREPGRWSHAGARAQGQMRSLERPNLVVSCFLRRAGQWHSVELTARLGGHVSSQLNAEGTGRRTVGLDRVVRGDIVLRAGVADDDDVVATAGRRGQRNPVWDVGRAQCTNLANLHAAYITRLGGRTGPAIPTTAAGGGQKQR